MHETLAPAAPGASPRLGVELTGTRGLAALLVAAGLAANMLPGEQGIPCPLRTMTGVPCPLCGMTTSVTAALRGDFGAAAAANPGGIVVVVVAVLVLAGVLGRRPLVVPRWWVPIGLTALWIFELLRFGVL